MSIITKAMLASLLGSLVVLKMYAHLTEIRDKTDDNKFGTGWFAKIKASIGFAEVKST